MIPQIQSAVSLIAALLISAALWRLPMATSITVTAVAVALDCLNLGTDGLLLGPFHVYPDDVALAVLVLATLTLFLRYRPVLSREAIACGLLLALAIVNLLRGIVIFGFQAPVNSSRDILSFTIPPLAVMFWSRRLRLETPRLMRWLCWSAAFFCAVSLLRWAGIVPMPAVVLALDSAREVVRPVAAEYAMIIGLGLVALVSDQINNRVTLWGAAGALALGIITLLLQHRSVWVATCAGLGWIGIRTGLTSARRWLTSVTVVVLGLIFLAISNQSVNSKLETLISYNIEEARGDDSTLAWRMKGYVEAIDRFANSDALNMAIGPAAGQYDAANMNASFASVHIHSRYVSMLAYCGVVGTFIFIFWIGLLARRLWRLTRTAGHVPSGKSNVTLQALFFAVLFYFGPYSGSIPISLLLGFVYIAAVQAVPRVQLRRQLSSYSQGSASPAVAMR